MPVHGEALFKAAVMLAEVEEMQVTVVNTFASSAAAALAGTGGFLILGPPGIAIGATLAGFGAYCYNKNKFKPLFVILQEDLRPQQQQELLDLLREAFADVDHMDFVKLYLLLVNKAELWEKMRHFLMVWATEYFMKELSVNNVKVEVKEMTDLEKYQTFTEEFKRKHGLPAAACPSALGMGGSSVTGVPAPAPGWQSVLAASAAGLTPTPETSTQTDEPASNQAELSEVAGQTPPAPETSTQTDEPASNLAEEDQHLPTVPKTALRTTF